MNSELVKQALEKVANSGVLVNLISCRVRQLNSGNAGPCRPMVAHIENASGAAIALREIIEAKTGFEMPEVIGLTRPTGRNRKRPQGWVRIEPDRKSTRLNSRH